jgi:hypothetical protein
MKAYRQLRADAKDKTGAIQSAENRESRDLLKSIEASEVRQSSEQFSY